VSAAAASSAENTICGADPGVQAATGSAVTAYPVVVSARRSAR